MRSFSFTATILIMALSSIVRAQADIPKTEIGVNFSLLNIERVGGRSAEPGFGGRFTYNVTKSVGLEAELNLFPKHYNGTSNEDGGHITQGLFGARIGKRFRKVGVFAKARPGFVSFGQAILTRDSRSTTFQFGRLTHFALDLGGVLETYPTRHTVVRFDLGDTLVRYGRQNFTDAFGNLSVSGAFTRHNLQFSGGVGFRF